MTRRCPADAARRALRLALVLTDNDGVLTDGTVYVGPGGEHMKAYSVRDGMGVERLRERGIATGVVTREPPDLIAPRAQKLALRHLWTSVRDKHTQLDRILDETGLWFHRAQHRWHHAIDYAPPGKNYGTKFAFWDHLFGTADRRPGKPAGYGLAEPFPGGFLAQQAHAFRRRT